MPKINRISTLQYLGSKNRMLENICTPIIEDASIDKVVDLFAGTGSVGYALSPYKAIISNDFEYYSYVLNEAILNGCMITEQELIALYDRIERRSRKSEEYLHIEIAAEKEYLYASLDLYEEYAAFSNSTPSVFNNGTENRIFTNLKCLVREVVPGKKTQNVPFPCLFTTYFANAYFGIKQCCQIDAIASAIAELYDERQRNVLFAALMTATSSTASSTTHFAQFLTVKSKSTFKNIREKRSTDIIALFRDTLSTFSDKGLLDRAERQHRCLNLDFEECLHALDMNEHTLVYADPPYFKEHYSRYYHVLNTMCLYDYPELAINPQSKEYAIGRYRVDRNISDFGKKAKALSAFQRLIDSCADKKAKLVISYSENSIVKIYELLQLAKSRYNVRVDRISLKHSSQGRSTNSDQTVKEYLFICTLPDNGDIEIEKKANAIKAIKPIVDNPGGFIHNYMARKPYNVVSAIINSFSLPGELVFDPMFGSGTTLIEASKLERRAVGIDINPIASEICSISLRHWDLSKVNDLIDQFVAEVERACSAIYTFVEGDETRIIERCHFDITDSGLIPTLYWYKINGKKMLSGRKRSEVSAEFTSDYESFGERELIRLQDHALIPNSRIAIKEKSTVFSYFCKRNLVALDKIFEILDRHKTEYGYEVLRLLVSSSINLIKLSDKKASSQMPYWLPKKNVTSRNAYFVIKQKATAMKEGLAYLQENCKSFIDDGDISIYTMPAQDLGAEALHNGSVDLVLTDPPYTDQVPYLEYNQLWLYLFGMEDELDLENELVVSDAPTRKKGNEEFDDILKEIVGRTAVSLKENGVFVMFYHTFDLQSWSNILTMMQANKLRYVYQIPTAAPRKSFKTIMSPRSTLDGNYLLFFVKDSNLVTKAFNGDIADAVEMAKSCAARIIRSQEHVTTQDLYDHGMLKEAFEEGYLVTLSEKYKSFAEVIKDGFRFDNGYWEALE